MFASLVIVFPVAHTGGALVFRHGKKEWTVDAAQLLFGDEGSASEAPEDEDSANEALEDGNPAREAPEDEDAASETPEDSEAPEDEDAASEDPEDEDEEPEETRPCIAFVAFHSDIEHEVLPVESGNRVTVTYNLYYEPTWRSTPDEVNQSSSTERVFEDTLKATLADESFLAKGGYLGFGTVCPPAMYEHRADVFVDIGLRHLYAFSHDKPARDDMLKGTDALIKRVCDRLGLRSQLKVFYETDQYEVLMLNKMADLGQDEVEHGEVNNELQSQGVIVESHDDERIQNHVFWVNHAYKKNKAGTPYVAYGNEASLNYVYGEFNLVVTVGPFENRAATPRWGEIL